MSFHSNVKAADFDKALNGGLKFSGIGWGPQIIVTTDKGASVTCSLGETVLQEDAPDGKCKFVLDDFGDWTITEYHNLGDEAVVAVPSRTVHVTECKQYKETLYANAFVTTEKVEGYAYKLGIIDTSTMPPTIMPPDKLALMAKLIALNPNITKETYTVYFHYGNEHYRVNVGDYTFFEMDNTEGKKENYEPIERNFQIIGFNHDELANKKRYDDHNVGVSASTAGITFQMQYTTVNTHKMNDTADNTTAWESSKMRTETMPEFLSRMPKEWTKHMTPVVKRTGYSSGSQNTVDTLFLLSKAETTGDFEGVWNGGGETQYKYYAHGNSAKKGYDYSFRSPRANNSANFTYCRENSDEGVMASTAANTPMRVSLAFCM